MLASACLLFSFAASSQSTPGLIFKNPQLISGTDLQRNAVYLFQNVATGTDARVSIDSLVNGAEVRKIDDNTAGVGYINALQPEVRTPGGTRESYAVFTISFYVAGTTTPKMVDSLQATALDIDGNATLKEFCEIDMNGGTASYMSNTLDISVVNILLRKFRGTNILGIERNGIDTSAYGNMYTVKKNNVSSFTLRFGSITVGAASASRQFSLYMKGFNYPNQIILPVKLSAFTAILGDNKVDLRWTTSAEKNASHFVVEKSTDGKNFSEAGLVFAMGNTSADISYQFTDNRIDRQTGNIFYRLRAVDIDGRAEYSDVRIIHLGNKQGIAFSVTAFPNPATTEIRVTIPREWQDKTVKYELVSLSGQPVLSVQDKNSTQTKSLPLQQVAPGAYILRVSSQGASLEQKIIRR